MLIVSRKIDESIIIGDEITVTVLAVKGNQVRIGINAPSDVSVHREEIYVRVMGEQHKAQQPVPKSEAKVTFRKARQLPNAELRGER